MLKVISGHTEFRNKESSWGSTVAQESFIEKARYEEGLGERKGTIWRKGSEGRSAGAEAQS